MRGWIRLLKCLWRVVSCNKSSQHKASLNLTQYSSFNLYRYPHIPASSTYVYISSYFLRADGLYLVPVKSYKVRLVTNFGEVAGSFVIGLLGGLGSLSSVCRQAYVLASHYTGWLKSSEL